MGDPRKNRKKYTTPRHPWQKVRIDEERELLNDYGLKNKKDLWKSSSKLGQLKKQAKSLIGKRDVQAETEKKLFLEKLEKLKLLKDGSTVANVLDLSVKDILERRLQTILLRKGYAKTMKQARQFITHGHVIVENKKINAPSYLVSSLEETTIIFDERSALADPEHPERKVEEKEIPKIEDEEKEEVKEE
jgi:small subunit ribosomal protein S4